MSRFGQIAATAFAGALAGLVLGAVSAQAELGPGQPGGPPGQYIRRGPPPGQPNVAPQIQQQPQRFVRPAPPVNNPQPQVFRPQPQVFRPQPQVFRPQLPYRPPVANYRPPERRWERPRYRPAPQVYFQPSPPQVYYRDPPDYVELYPVYGGYTTAYRPRRSNVIANYCETEIDTCDIAGTMFVGRSCRCYFPGYGKVPGVAIE